MDFRLPRREIVLVGCGHTHAHVLRQWRMAPVSDARLTLVSDQGLATYSGMLPGTLAGLYPAGAMQIDLVRLCASAGVRLLQAEVAGLDPAAQRLLLVDRPPIPFDVLSIGIGSIPRGLPGNVDYVVPIKPMQNFLERLQAAWLAIQDAGHDRPFRVIVVGAGAGGVEIALCLPGFLERQSPARGFEITLLDGNGEILPGSPAATIRLVRRALARRHVGLHLGQAVHHADQMGLHLDNGQQLAADLVIWATGAAPPPLLEILGLPRDSQGFLWVDQTLRAETPAPILAVGDCATLRERSTPKAGVYAVRQGPFLWENLKRQLRGDPLVPYRPQRGFLSLLAVGDGTAVLTYKGWSLAGRGCWWLKDRIDRRFMAMYQDYSLSAMQPLTATAPVPAMRCQGCGSKVGGSVLSRVLARLEIPPSQHVLLGLATPDDAAIYQSPQGRPVVATVDFFTAFLDDAYLVGRVAALNSVSDAFSVGAKPLAALAIATIPQGDADHQEELLVELLSGALRELSACGATLIGGHTIEGPQVSLGFTILADGGLAAPRLKSGLRAGDLLVLTKPLGSGILLAAHQRALVTAEWMEALRTTLVASNQFAAELVGEFDVQGVTDVTGFGLAGHLLEMLRASQVDAELRLADIPLLPGAKDLIQRGIESTLAPANRAAETELDQRNWQSATRPERVASYQALFDPQTSGGLLLGISAQDAARLLERLAQHAAGACVIGRVLPRDPERGRIRLV